MSVPGEDQDQLIRRIGRALLGAAPPNWRQIRAEYRSAGRHIEADVIVTGEDSRPQPIRPPMDVVELLGELRTAMYQPGRGTWMSGVYLLDHPSKYSAEFEPDVEPRWRRVPPPIGFQDELRQFPRSDDHIPDWLRARAGMQPPPAQPVADAPTPGALAPGPPSPTAPHDEPASVPPQGQPLSSSPGQTTLPGHQGQPPSGWPMPSSPMAVPPSSESPAHGHSLPPLSGPAVTGPPMSERPPEAFPH
jgi:hypothetical protein